MKNKNSNAPSRSAMIDEALKKSIHKINQDVKIANDGFSFEDGNIAKGYLAGDLYLCVGMVWRDRPRLPQFADCYAFIEAVQPSINYDASDRIFYGEMANAPQIPPVCGGDKLKVLVNVRETKDGAEFIVPSIVRFFPYHQLYKIGVDPRGIFLPAGLESLKAITSRELDLFNIGDRIAKPREGDRNLIKSGPQVVDNFGGKDVNHLGGNFGQSDFGKFVASVLINIDEKFWCVSQPKTLLSSVELFEQSLCPLDFQRRAIKHRFIHGENL